LGERLQNDANALRRRLAGIPSIPRPMALRLARRIRLNPLTRRFERSLDLAKQVLDAAFSDLSSSARSEAGAWHWKVVMSERWEHLIVEALDAAKGGGSWKAFRYGAGNREATVKPIEPPWKGHGTDREPDILVESASGNWILDAKYKSRQDLDYHSDVDRDDDLQMFAYARLALASDEQPFARNLALVYPRIMPSSNGDPSRSPDEAHGGGALLNGLWTGPDDGRPHLHRVFMTFPSFDDVRTHQDWRKYLSEAGARLARQLDLNTRPDAPDAPDMGFGI